MVEIVLDWVITSTSNSSKGPVCDSEYRKTIVGTNEFFWFAEVCKVQMEGYTGVTDNFGTYKFSEFKITRGPEGLYIFRPVTSSGVWILGD